MRGRLEDMIRPQILRLPSDLINPRNCTSAAKMDFFRLKPRSILDIPRRADFWMRCGVELNHSRSGGARPRQKFRLKVEFVFLPFRLLSTFPLAWSVFTNFPGIMHPCQFRSPAARCVQLDAIVVFVDSVLVCISHLSKLITLLEFLSTVWVSTGSTS
jgi:hypothetical protein